MSCGSGPRQHCYISRPMGLQHSPLSLGPAARCGVDMLHNAPSPAPLPLPRGWLLGAELLAARRQYSDRSYLQRGAQGGGRNRTSPQVQVALEGLLGHNTGGHLPTPQRACSLFDKSLTLPHSHSVFRIKISCHHGGHGPEEPLGRRAALQKGASSLSFPPTAKPAEPHPRGAGATRSCPGGPAL